MGALLVRCYFLYSSSSEWCGLNRSAGSAGYSSFSSLWDLSSESGHSKHRKDDDKNIMCADRKQIDSTSHTSNVWFDIRSAGAILLDLSGQSDREKATSRSMPQIAESA